MKLCFNLDGNGCKEVKVDDKCTVDENNECKGDSCKFDENNVKWYYQKKKMRALGWNSIKIFFWWYSLCSK